MTPYRAYYLLFFLSILKPKKPCYGFIIRAQAIVIKALRIPLKVITYVIEISTRHIGNLIKKVVKNSWWADKVLLNNYLRISLA